MLRCDHCDLADIWADIFMVPCGKLLQDVKKPWENPKNMIYFRGGFSRSMLRGKLWQCGCKTQKTIVGPLVPLC